MNKLLLFKPKGIWREITPPTGWSWSLPFNIEQKGRKFRTWADWTIDGEKPTGKAYYVSTSGSDANDGLTAGTPLRKIYTAINKADVDVIYIAAGIYGWTNGWGGGDAPTRSMSVIATGGRVVIGTFAEGLSWTLDSGAYKATRSHVLKVADASFPDARGDHTFLDTVADAASCRSSPGTWYTDATYVWVHTSDSREPDTFVRCYFDNATYPGKYAGNFDGTLYLENIDFEGGSTGGFYSGYAGKTKTAYYNNCTFKYSSGNGTSAPHGGNMYLKDCVSACNLDDGYNWKLGSGPSQIKVVEIDCIGRDNGYSGDIDNGSSIHEGGYIVRLNGEYCRCVGRVIHDINDGTQSWLLGSIVHDSTSTVNDCNFACGSASGETTKMWLDCCTSYGSATDLEVTAAAALKYKNLTSNGVFVGSPTTY